MDLFKTFRVSGAGLAAESERMRVISENIANADTISDQAGGEPVEIGSILFEGEDFTYWDRHSAFVEVYATSKIPKSGIPKVNVSFSRPRLKGWRSG